jgi:nitrogen fixation protein FixH
MNAQPSGKPLTGRKVLVILLAFFGVVIGVNGAMMTLAIGTLPGIDVDTPYSAGLAYNAQIAAARAQAARDWNVTAHVERAPDGHASVRVEVRDNAGAPVTGVVFTGQLARPTDRRADRAIEFAERESGIFRADLEGVAAGQWDLIIAAERAHDGGRERLFLSRNRVVLK